MKTDVERTYGAMQSLSWRIEVYTSTDTWESLIYVVR